MKTVFKTILIAMLITASANFANAQDEYKTLLGNDISHGGYGAFSLGYTKVGDYNTFSPGMKGAWIINHGIGIGLAGSGFVTEPTTGIIPDEDYSLIAGGYGGFLIEPIFFGTNAVHFSVPIIIGGGAVAYVSDKYMPYNPSYPEYYYNNFDSFFVFEPGIELELNIVKFFRLALGVSYRFTSDINLTTQLVDETVVVLDKKDLNQLVVKLNFKFGKF